MPARAGDRTGLIFWGFRADTNRADIEDCLRKIMVNVDGVEKTQALGKFAIAGKMTFTDNDFMWAFIKANKNVKFKHEGEPRAIWFSIEKRKKNVGEQEGCHQSSAG